MGELRFGSLFSGIGGFDLGLENAGMTCAWQCEIDKDARAVLSEHWWDVDRYRDVKEVDASAPGVDVLAGGFPCQDLSVAGNRAGLAGERSGLFFEFMRVAGALAPRWVLVENVPGLLSSEEGRDMATVLGTLAELGYGWAYRVLDAQYFGVAQRRRRVFIVGCLGGASRAAQVLFEPQSCDGDPAPSREAGTRVATLTANRVGTCGADDNQGRAGHLIAFAHQAGGDHTASGAFCEDMSPTLQKSQTMPVAFHQIQDPISEEELSPALGAKSGGMGVAFSENQRGEILETDYAHQLTTGGGKPGQGYPAVRQNMGVRRLIPPECERLQGFPDNWTAGLSDSARYRTLGNAVAVPVAEWIGRKMMQAAEGRDE